MNKDKNTDKRLSKNLLKFVHEAETLKKILRHGWLSNGRRESVADHSWRITLMAIIFLPNLKKEKPDLLKTLKMLIIHDLCEIYCGDQWAFKKYNGDKFEKEKKGLKKLIRHLPKDQAEEFMDLFIEFEEKKTLEAKYAQALDKIEPIIQHNESDLKTYSKEEYRFNLYYGDEYFEEDIFLNTLKKIVRNESVAKYKKGKIDKKLYL